MNLPIEWQQELNELKTKYYFLEDEKILTSEEVMKILRIDSPRTLTSYIEAGLVCLNLKPRKFLMHDVRAFIQTMRKCNQPYFVTNIDLN